MFLRFEQTGLSLKTASKVNRRNPVLVLLPVDLIDDAQQIELMQGEAQFLGDLPPYRLFDRLQPIHLTAGETPTTGFGISHSPDQQSLPSWMMTEPQPNRGSGAIMYRSD